MSEKLLKILMERLQLMKNDPKIQAKMMEFSDSEEGFKWVVQLAIATLVVPKEVILAKVNS